SNPFGCELILILRERYTYAACPVLRGSAHDECSPATSDVEEALPGLNPDFTENVIDLLELSFIKRLIAAFEVAARKDHPVVQPKFVEVVGDVTVIAGGCLVPLPAVICPAGEFR